MSEPNQRPAIAGAPISVLLFARALCTETDDAVQSWRQYLDRLGRPYQLLLINETRPEVPPGEVAPGALVPENVFAYEHAHGFRTALRHAIESAIHPLLVFCTADKQYQPADLERLLKVIDKVDLVVGYRVGGQAPAWRVALDMVLGALGRVLLGVPTDQRKCWLGSKGWSRRFLASWVFGVQVLDPECPFRLARRTLFDRLPIQSGGPFAQLEMLAKANHLSNLVAEEPVNWSPPADSATDGVPFGQDARLVFSSPEFGISPRQEDPLPPVSPTPDVPAAPAPG